MGVQGFMSDWQTHVFTSTYTADVSGVCSMMYELGGMTVLHDPSGCNSTYTTHDEPRWYDTDSLMYISGLDEITAVYGDDSVIIRDVIKAAQDLNPRFITLCGASIPHIIAFDYKGSAHLIEKETGIPVLPVATNGLQGWTHGCGLSSREWIRRFADTKCEKNPHSVNVMGLTPIDFSRMEIADQLCHDIEEGGWKINARMAMGDTFDNLTKIYGGTVNLVVSSAGRMAARFMKAKGKVPMVEGLPIGAYMSQRVQEALAEAEAAGESITAYDHDEELSLADMIRREDTVLVIGEEVFARSLVTAINHSKWAETNGLTAYAMSPDETEGIDEEMLVEAMKHAKVVIADPLYKLVPHGGECCFIPFAHEGYSGRIFRDSIPAFAAREFDIEKLLEEGE